MVNKIFELKFGSHLYATNTENSDLDLKSIYLPTAKEICLGNYKKTITTTRPKQEFERNNKDDVDVEIFSLDRYLELLLEGQTVALDILFAGKEMYTYSNPDTIWIMEEIYKNRFELLHSNLNAFIGYSKAQAAKYGIKGFRVHALRATLDYLNQFDDQTELNSLFLQFWIDDIKNEYIKLVNLTSNKGVTETYLEVCDKKYILKQNVKYVKERIQKRFDEYGKRALMAEDNKGIDWKALSHAVRVNNEAIELLTTGKITFPRPDKDLLLNIKLGKLPYKEVTDLIENGLEDLKKAEKNSILNKTPNKQWAEDFVYKIYSDIVSKENPNNCFIFPPVQI